MQDDSYNTDGSKSSGCPDSVEGDIVERLGSVLRRAMRFLDYAAGEGIALNTGGEELDAGDIMTELVDVCDVADPEDDIIDPICAAILAQAEEKAVLRARCEALEGALAAMRVEAVLLLNNAEGCAQNHYGDDYRDLGAPQWLVDARENIGKASAALSHRTPSPEAK